MASSMMRSVSNAPKSPVPQQTSAGHVILQTGCSLPQPARTSRTVLSARAR